MGARICCWTRAWLQTDSLSKPAIVLLAYNDHLQVNGKEWLGLCEG
jgi:hypothetical protein